MSVGFSHGLHIQKEGAKPHTKINPRSMETAVNACLEGNGFREAAQEFQVLSLTIKSYIRKEWEKEVQISY